MATLLYIVGTIVLVVSLIKSSDVGFLETIYSAGPIVLIMQGIASIINRLDRHEKLIYNLQKNENQTTEYTYSIETKCIISYKL